MPPEPLTLLLTDVEGSTRLARELGDAWPEVVADHHRILRDAIAGRGGRVERETGDAFLALFERAPDAAAAAADAQRALAAHDWPPAVGELRVRMGIHTGAVDRSRGDLTGLDIHLAARVEAAAHGGQVVLTAATRRELDGAFELADLGAHRLKDFPEAERLFLLVHDGRGADAFPPLRTDPARPTNLPPQPCGIVGREHELRELWEVLESRRERFVTLLGLGGSGKTRLAIAAGEGLLLSFDGGVWLVALTGIAEPDALVPAIAGALGVVDAPNRPLVDAVVERLRRRPTLLVLDNFEQLVDAAPVVRDLLDRAPDAAALVTSQLPLRVAGEHVYRVEPLPSDAAVALFAERARAVFPAFEAEADREAIAAVCARVDELPLAIELAAARMATMSPRDLLARLDCSFGVLARGPRDAPQRHRSLEATLEWAHGLLRPEERTLLARLSVFAGPVPLDAVEAVAAVDGEHGPIGGVDALAGLLDASLARRRESRDHGLRYKLPEAVRVFAAGHLAESGEEAAVRRAHAAHVLEHAAAALRWGPGQDQSLLAGMRALRAEHSGALAWARVHDPELHLHLVSALAYEMKRTARTHEAHTELGVALARFPVRGAVAGWAALQYVSTSLGYGGTPPELIGRALAAVRADGDDELLAKALLLESKLVSTTGDAEAGLAPAEEAVAVRRRSGDVAGTAYALAIQAQALCYAGRLDEADEVIAASAALGADLDPTTFTVASVASDIAVMRGEWVEAARWYAESAAAAEERGCTEQTIMDFQGLATSLAGAGDHDGAIEAAAAASSLQAITSEAGMETDPAWRERLEAAEKEAWSALGPGRAAEAEARGRALPAARRAARAKELADATAAAAPQ